MILENHMASLLRFESRKTRDIYLSTTVIFSSTSILIIQAAKAGNEYSLSQ